MGTLEELSPPVTPDEDGAPVITPKKDCPEDSTGIYVALDKESHDMFKYPGMGITRVSDGRFVVQQAQCKLRTILGEWVLDRNIGFINFRHMGAQYSLYDIELRVLEVVTNIMHVKSVYDIQMDMVDRRLYIDFKAMTTFGEIDTTVPWGLGKGLSALGGCSGGSGEVLDPNLQADVVHTGILVEFGNVQVTHTI